jgi:SHS2 domain-containing protein
MSWWIMPTTADIGFRVFAPTVEETLRESALAMQSIQLSERGARELPQHQRSVAEWSVDVVGGDLERGLVRWLEEVLYQGAAENRWLVDASLQTSQNRIAAQVTWVDSEFVELEVEVKAVTLHDLVLREIFESEMVEGVDSIPTFEGPGWMAQVVLDI